MLGIAQRYHCRAHHSHAEKEDTQTCNNTTGKLDLFLFDKKNQGNTCKCNQRRDGPDVQGYELAGHGGSDIGAHDDPDSLFERHELGVDEAYHHDGCGG